MKIPELTGIDKVERPVFFCSFGKDSSSVLHALQPWLEKVMVVFVDFGGMYPDITEWAEREGPKLPHFFYVHPPGDIWEDVRTKGWPVDVQFADFGPDGAGWAQDPESASCRLRTFTDFYRDRLWLPMYVFTQMYGADCLITGEKSKDRPYAMDWMQRTNNTSVVIRPVFDWTDEEVWEYVDGNGIQLPDSSQTRDPKRGDTYVSFGGHDLTPELILGMKERWPEYYQKVFIEKGMRSTVSTMVRKLTEIKERWEAVQKVVEE